MMAVTVSTIRIFYEVDEWLRHLGLWGKWRHDGCQDGSQDTSLVVHSLVHRPMGMVVKVAWLPPSAILGREVDTEFSLWGVKS